MEHLVPPTVRMHNTTHADDLRIHQDGHGQTPAVEKKHETIETWKTLTRGSLLRSWL